MDIQEHIKYWIESAENDLSTAETLFETGHYDWCLFIGHLILEKILKAHYVKIFREVPPKIHNLIRLSEKASIPLSYEQNEFFGLVNSFNIEGRYPELKQELYKIATKDFTKTNFDKIRDIYLWLKSQLI